MTAPQDNPRWLSVLVAAVPVAAGVLVGLWAAPPRPTPAPDLSAASEVSRLTATIPQGDR